MTDSNNYFELLNLATRFDLADSQILNHYHQAMRLNHPDRQNNTDNEAEKIQKTSLINKAYFELKEPLKRAIYLLELNHQELAKNINNSTEQGSFLLEKMNLYEKLEEIQNKAGLTELNQFQLGLKDKLDTIFSQLADYFTNKEFKLAREKIIACQFYQQILTKSKNIKAKNL